MRGLKFFLIAVLIGIALDVTIAVLVLEKGDNMMRTYTVGLSCAFLITFFTTIFASVYIERPRWVWGVVVPLVFMGLFAKQLNLDGLGALLGFVGVGILISAMFPAFLSLPKSETP